MEPITILAGNLARLGQVAQAAMTQLDAGREHHLKLQWGENEAVVSKHSLCKIGRTFHDKTLPITMTFIQDEAWDDYNGIHLSWFGQNGAGAYEGEMIITPNHIYGIDGMKSLDLLRLIEMAPLKGTVKEKAAKLLDNSEQGEKVQLERIDKTWGDCAWYGERLSLLAENKDRSRRRSSWYNDEISPIKAQTTIPAVAEKLEKAIKAYEKLGGNFTSEIPTLLAEAKSEHAKTTAKEKTQTDAKKVITEVCKRQSIYNQLGNAMNHPNADIEKILQKNNPPIEIKETIRSARAIAVDINRHQEAWEAQQRIAGMVAEWLEFDPCDCLQSRQYYHIQSTHGGTYFDAAGALDRLSHKETLTPLSARLLEILQTRKAMNEQEKRVHHLSSIQAVLDARSLALNPAKFQEAVCS